MSLKAFDLIWVVGKSAAWRYPGEIPELKSFAPAVPDQATDPVFKKTGMDLSSTTGSGTSKKSEPAGSGVRGNPNKKGTGSRSVYVNLPAGQKPVAVPPARVLNDLDPAFVPGRDPAYDFSDIYRKKSSSAARLSGKVLWVSTIALLFGAGILTGFFISDRRKFFSTRVHDLQTSPAAQPTALSDQKEISPAFSTTGRNKNTIESVQIKTDSVKSAGPVPRKLISGAGKKPVKKEILPKDTAFRQNTALSSLMLHDSLKQNTISKTEMLYQKIKAHPENYIGLVTGRFSTGMFGGISSFPVTVTNNSPVLMDLVVVNIDYIQNNEKIFKTESISFNDLEAGETVTIKAPKSPRGIKIATRIHIVNSRQLDLRYTN